MALFDRFKKGKEEGEEGTQPDSNGQAKGFQPKPDKARRFFEHASAAHDATNFGYAMTHWLNGLRLDPDDTSALDRFEESTKRWIQKEGKAKGPTAEQKKGVSSEGEQGKFAQALLAWGARGFEWSLGLKAMQTANKLGSDEAAFWIGERVMRTMRADEKAKKQNFVDLMDEFEECNGFDKAVQAGEAAIQLDPTDGKLVTRVKNLSAQQAMATGGFDESGEEGAFRGRIRDKDAQQKLGQEDQFARTEGSLDQQIEDAKRDYQSRSKDLGAIQKLSRLLRQRGKGDDLKLAYQVLKKGYDELKVYRLKQEAGEIELRVAAARIHQMEDQLAKQPQDADLATKLEKMKAKRRDIELREITEQVREYPTELKLKYRLGRLHFDAEQYEEAIGYLQQAKNAQGVQGQVMLLLGQSFLRLGWANEAEATFRGALERHRTPDDELGLELRYGLLKSLQAKAESDDDAGAGAADEAFEIASKIAVQQINFKDIRQVREDLTALRKKLKEGE